MGRVKKRLTMATSLEATRAAAVRYAARMRKSATEVMQDIVAAAVLDAIAALKAASKGLPNNLLRDLNAIHANTTLADLLHEVQAEVSASVRAAFSRLQKEGYSVSSGEPAAPRPPRPGTAPPAGQHRPFR